MIKFSAVQKCKSPLEIFSDGLDINVKLPWNIKKLTKSSMSFYY